jgi:hypothetical protein
VHHVKAREPGSDNYGVKRFRVEHDLYATRKLPVREYIPAPAGRPGAGIVTARELTG